MLSRKRLDPRFDPGARKAMLEAAEAARALSHPYVGPEHLLIALLQEDGAAARLLRTAGGDPKRAVGLVSEHVKRGTEPVPSGDLPFTSRMKKTLEAAFSSARARAADAVSAEDLLVGLAGEGRSIASQTLASMGVDSERLEAALSPGPEVSANASRVESLDVRIDDSSSLSIYEQVVAQIQEAVATRRLSAGARLPTVRQLADHLDIAPGTVARAYGELEQLGVIVTEGARGTRVAEREPSGIPAEARPETLVGLLRPVAVAAFHLGASAQELRDALERAMEGIFGEQSAA